MDEQIIPVEEKRTPKQELSDLRNLVTDLTDKVSTLTNAPKTNRVTKRTQEHFVTLREYQVNDEVKGIVTRLYDVREIKDDTENKRYRGLCKIDVLNPKTGVSETFKDVDWLEFLDKALRVKAKILKIDVLPRYETDPRKGGGGVGALYRQGPNNEYVVDMEFDYVVGYADKTYTLQIQSGAFENEVFTNNGSANNL